MADSNREEITKLEALYASNPGGRVFVHLAEACRKAGEHERARAILDEGLSRHDDSASGYVVLGRVLSDMGEQDEAETAFRRVLELDPGNLIALRWIEDRDHAPVEDRDPIAAEDQDTDHPPEAERDDIRVRADELVDSAEAGPVHTAGKPDDAAEHDSAQIHDSSASTDVEWAAAAEESAAPSDDAAADFETRLEDVVTPASAAPGFTDEDDNAAVEFGVTDGESLPGDLASFANIGAEAPGVSDSIVSEDHDPEQSDISDMDWSDMGADADETFIADLESQSDFDVDSLDPGDGEHSYDAAPLPVRALDASPATEPDESGSDDAESETAEWSDLADGEYEESRDPDLAEGASDDVAEESDDGWEGTTSFEPPVFEEPEWAGDLTVAPLEETKPAVESGADPVTDVGALAGVEAPADVEPVAGLEAGGYDGALGGPVADRESAADGLHTETIAELYSSQGFHDRAAEVYRSLLRRRPGDDRLAALLADAEAKAGKGPGRTGPDLEEDEYGEVWLSASGAEWAPEAQRTEPSPYGWTEQSDDTEGADAADSSPAIRSYLQSLVSWTPAAAKNEAENTSAPDDAAVGADGTIPGADDAVAGADDAVAGYEPWAETVPPVEPWTSAEAVSEVEQPEATPDPWAPDPTSAVPVAPIEGSTDRTPPAPRSKDPVEAAFLEWFDSDDEPANASQSTDPGHAAEPGANSAAEPGPAGGSGADDARGGRAEFGADPVPPMTIPLEESSVEGETDSGEDEDEDLEMFRSWLQSLKK